MKKEETASSYYFMSILICVVVVIFQLIGYWMVLNASELNIYPDFNIDITSEQYYILLYYVVSFFTIIMSGWGISASFAAAKSNGVVRGSISYIFAFVHFVILIILVGSVYLAITDIEGLRTLIQEYLEFIPIR